MSKSHKRRSVEQYDRFKKFYRNWSLKHVADSEHDPIESIAPKASRTNNNDERQLEIRAIVTDRNEDLVQPPYRHYRQYRSVQP